MLRTKQLAQFSPGRVIIFAIFLTILGGALLLSLPAAHKNPIPFIDLIFTSASATCVTGLFTVPLGSFTTFGHSIILLLIQIGGLGVITLTLSIMSLFVDLGFTTQLMAGQILDIDSWKNTKKILVFIILLTLAIELCGAACIFLAIYPKFTIGNALFLSLFHAVSSFCNAGISLLEDANSLALFSDHPAMLLITSILITCGGLGFIVWLDIFRRPASDMHIKRRRHGLSLLSKIVLNTTILIIICATIIIWIFERNGSFGSMGFIQSWINALFYAISLRSTGFVTVPVASLQIATLLIIMLITFIGSSPGSTGSGVKVTVFTILFATVKAAISGNTSTNIRGRRIPRDQVLKSVAIVFLSVSWIFFATLFLLITETGMSFMHILLESVSAFSNLGLTTGFTQSLSFLGKIGTIISMIVGRIGSLTLVLALRKTAYKKSTEEAGIVYPEERIMLS